MGWSLLNAPLLSAAALISVPILIHLFNRRQFKVVRWGAMDFLLQASKENKRKVKIQHLLVLLLRCLAIILLALFLARPAISSAGLGFLPGVEDQVERVVILDDSGSLAYRSGRTTAFSRSKRILKRFVEDLARERPRDSLIVIRASTPNQAERLEAPGSEETQRFLERLLTYEPGSSSLDLPRLVESALGDKPPAGKKTVVYVISDMRRRDWQGAEGEIPRRVAEALRASGRTADGQLRFLGVDTGGEGTRNLGIVGIEPVDKLAMAGLPYEVRVRVRNYGEADVAQVPIYVQTRDASGSDGRVTLPPITSIKAGQEAVVVHRPTFLGAGPQSLSFELGGDALPLDNTRHLALRVQEELQALLVEGEKGETPLSGDAALLALALAPPGDALSGVEPRIVPEADLAGEDLDSYDSIVLCNVKAWPSDRRAELERFVRRGGGLAIFLGSRVDARSYEAVLYRDGEGLLPVSLGDEVEAEAEDKRPSLAPPEGNHPLTMIFGGERNPFLSRVRASRWREVAIDAQKDGLTRAVMKLENETPILLEKSFGKGRVLLFNTSANNDWSSWPRNPSWPIVAQDLVRLLAPPSHRGLVLACNEPLQVPLDPGRFETQAKLQLPGDRQARELFAAPVEGAPLPQIRFMDTSKAGIYRLSTRLRKGGDVLSLLAANLDASEGDLTPAQTEAFVGGLQSAGLESVQATFVSGDDQTALLRVTDGTRAELWRLVLRIMLVVLLIEQVLAWWAAHHLPPRRAPEQGPEVSA
jgi:aerotolerance regulator-like protein